MSTNKFLYLFAFIALLLVLALYRTRVLDGETGPRGGEKELTNVRPAALPVERYAEGAGFRNASLNATNQPSQPTPAEYKRRRRSADEFAYAGDMERAVQELLWCYEHHSLAGSGVAARAGVRIRLVHLAKTHEQANNALLQLRVKAEESFVLAPNNPDSILELAYCNQALRDNEYNVRLFDMLAEADIMKRPLGAIAFDELMQQGRYREAVQAKGFANMVNEIELVGDRINRYSPEGRAELISNLVKNVVALVRSGRESEAGIVANMIVKLDGTELGRQAVSDALMSTGRR